VNPSLRAVRPNAPAPMSRAAVRAQVEALGPWFHNLDLGGIRTAPSHPLGDYPAIKWARFAPAIAGEIAGRSVLDIGCNGGFYSIEMKRRGAARVVAIDLDERYLAQAQFAARVCGTDIEFRRLSVYEVAALRERFDIVLFMGVLYHLRHPLLALDLINEHVMGDLLVFQSMQRGSSALREFDKNYEFWDVAHFDAPAYPKLHFIEHRYADDPTNWWVPNRACVEAMLRSAGFAISSHPEEEVYLCRRSNAPDGGGAVYPARG
jgi:tRNA (mo5U34)-methyltransferase